MSKAVCMEHLYRHRAYRVNMGKMPFARGEPRPHSEAMPKRVNRPGSFPDRVEVGARLVAMREELGLLKAEMADQLQCDRTTWGKYESGERDLTLAVAWRIFRLHGFSLDYLFDGKAYGIPEHHRAGVIRRLTQRRAS